MKNLTYFLILLLGIGFSSTAQEEMQNPLQQTDTLATEVEFYYINPCPPLRTRSSTPKTYQAYDYNSRTRSFLMKEYYFDIAFHNAHSGNNIELYLLIDDTKIKDAHFTNVLTSNNFIDVERYYQYGESEFYPLQLGFLHTQYLYGWR